ncbi:MAG TPA: tRNA epoxyqueuosine(34) reductase QueG, partial [Candidatus Avibacteroides avistercoris]|nr:tRNA epoxyqueuosine(34) reductase QueG [Candidatus Avibacteroides avistercoris]
RLDARRCLSCQTIEHRGPLAPATIGCLGDRIYGCDTCQMVCPHNHGVPAGGVPEFAPSGELLSMTVADWAALTEERYRRLFRGSAVKRAKYEGLMRNIRAALSARGGRGNQ